LISCTLTIGRTQFVIWKTK